MKKSTLTKEGQQVLDTVLIRRAPIIKEKTKARILWMASLLMNDRGLKEAGKTLVIEAARLVTSGGTTPIFDKIEDTDKFIRNHRELKFNKDAYYAQPVLVKRWEPAPNQPLKRPEEMKVLALNSSPRKGVTPMS